MFSNCSVENKCGWEFFCQIEKSCEIRGSQIKYSAAVAKEGNSSISIQRKMIESKAADDPAGAAAEAAGRCPRFLKS